MRGHAWEVCPRNRDKKEPLQTALCQEFLFLTVSCMNYFFIRFVIFSYRTKTVYFKFQLK